MSRIPPLSWLRAFEAAARSSSVTGGARELNVTPSAVSQHIKRLEDRLGVSLMTREGNRVRLSREGRDLADRLREAFEIVQDALDPLSGRRLARTVTIRAPAAFARYWLAPRVERFNRESAHLLIAIQSPELESNAPPDIDLTYAEAPPAANARLLFQDWVAPVAAPGQPAEARRENDVAGVLLDAANQPASWAEWFALTGAPVPNMFQRVVVPRDDLAIEAARIGIGAALARHSSVESLLERGRLVLLSPARLGCGSVWITPLAEADRSALQRVVAWLANEASRYRTLALEGAAPAG
ncbi:MAG: LysR family transcriptional regulator [Rhizobiales bacterium]|nr:LysR family transcriptional regulator [Hyphomicrobiales bacterium]